MRAGRRLITIGLTMATAIGACTSGTDDSADGPSATTTPPTVPTHPFMADSASNNMHGDSFASDTHRPSGPEGDSTTVRLAEFGALSAGHAFDREGRIVTVCGRRENFELALVDPDSLEMLDSVLFPPRPSAAEALYTGDLQLIFEDTSGGAYFFLDNQERVVLVDSDQVLRVVAIDDTADGPHFVEQESYDLVSYVTERDCFSDPDNLEPIGNCDAVTSVLPDWEGTYWWVSRFGVVGTVDPETGDVRTIVLDGEEIENSFAVGPDGVFIVSDHAMYSFRAADDGTPEVVWRETYNRSDDSRPGQISHGSGSTPTLLGSDLVAIGSGADPIEVVVMHRASEVEGERTLCTVPVFERGASASENSPIGVDSSVIIQNTFGYQNMTTLEGGLSVPGGLVRVDIDRDAGSCSIAWESGVPAPSATAKLSVGSGLVYTYTKPATDGADEWWWTALDVETGEVAYEVLAGEGRTFDNTWGTISVGPDGSAYIGVLGGMLQIHDES